MKVTAPKESILKKIREALSETTPVPFGQSEGSSFVFNPPHDDLGVIFAEEFGKLQGHFMYCETVDELLQSLKALLAQLQFTKIYCAETPLTNILPLNWHADIAGCDASITGCECLVARTGTIVLSSAQATGRTASVYAPVHICLAWTNQLVYDSRDALVMLKEKYAGQLPSLISFATGPSRTADIEKTLVKGIHGPKDVFCFLLEGDAPIS